MSQHTQCTYIGLARGSTTSTPEQRYGSAALVRIPRSMRPASGRVRAGHNGPAVREHEAAGERCHPAVQLVSVRAVRLSFEPRGARLLRLRYGPAGFGGGGGYSFHSSRRAPRGARLLRLRYGPAGFGGGGGYSFHSSIIYGNGAHFPGSAQPHADSVNGYKPLLNSYLQTILHDSGHPWPIIGYSGRAKAMILKPAATATYCLPPAK